MRTIHSGKHLFWSFMRFSRPLPWDRRVMVTHALTPHGGYFAVTTSHVQGMVGMKWRTHG